jgi:hypothetical protein
MKTMRWSGLLTLAAMGAAAADTPQVLFRIELADAQRIIDCPVMSGPLGRSFTTALANGMAFSGKTTPLDAEGVTTITVLFPAGAKPSVMTAKLEQQKPSLQTSVGGTDLRLTVVVESPELLAITQSQPAARTFRGGSGPAFRRLDAPATCEPLLRRAPSSQ